MKFRHWRSDGQFKEEHAGENFLARRGHFQPRWGDSRSKGADVIGAPPVLSPLRDSEDFWFCSVDSVAALRHLRPISVAPSGQGAPPLGACTWKRRSPAASTGMRQVSILAQGFFALLSGGFTHDRHTHGAPTYSEKIGSRLGSADFQVGSAVLRRSRLA